MDHILQLQRIVHCLMHSTILSTINLYINYIPYAGQHAGVGAYLRRKRHSNINIALLFYQEFAITLTCEWSKVGQMHCQSQ